MKKFENTRYLLPKNFLSKKIKKNEINIFFIENLISKIDKD